MLTRWNHIDGDLDRLVRSVFFNDSARPTGRFEEAKYLAPSDVVETEGHFEVQVDLPGHDPKSIQVQVEKDVLSVRSERRAEVRGEKDAFLRVERTHGVFARSFSLPKNVDAQNIEATYEHGVLKVRVPKREEEKPRTIAVKVG